jgi:hypothetical protein
MRRALESLGFTCIIAAAGSSPAAQADWHAYAGLPIVEVQVTAREIFDAQAAESNLFYGWANALHMRTRASVIKRELLFSEGDSFDPVLVAESARNLRSIGIFQDVVFDVSRQGPGVLVSVVTDDHWATRVIADISSEGSILRLRLGLENANFLGRAIRVGGNMVASTDVNAVSFLLSDPRLLGSRWRAGLRYSADELAILNEARLGRPYYSEFVRWTSDFDYRSLRGERRLFGPGSVTLDTLDVDETSGEALVAVHGHGSTRSRLGLLFSRRDISRALQHDQAAVGLVWGLMKRSYRAMRNVDRYDTNEDVGTGWTLQLGAGADMVALGAQSNRPFWRADAAWAKFVGESTLLGAAARHHGFADHGRMENARIVAEAWGFWQQADAALLAWNAGFFSLVREPEFLQRTLGGDTRLRGYSARHDVGTRTLYLSVEERVFSDLRLLFLRFGMTVFVDAGQAWDAGESPRWDAMDVGAGFGLRIGNRKSGAGISRLDFAFGRNHFEISLSGGSFFRAARGMGYLSASLLR